MVTHKLVGALAVTVLTALCASLCANSRERASYLSKVVAEFDKPWPENRMVVIVCHGHSVPTGYFTGGRVQPFDSYPHLTHVGLMQRYPIAVIEFIRTGIGGEHAEQGAARFADDVLAKKPDVVTIDYALNDRAIGLNRARVAWESMIEQAKAAGVRVLLMTPTADERCDFANSDDPLVQHAEQVRALAEEHDVGLVDSFAAFERAVADGRELGSLMSQVNHPNRDGHQLVADELLKWFDQPPTD